MKKMVIIIALLTGCNTFSYYNQKYSEDPGSEKEYRGIATFKIKEKDHNDRNLVLLALSGGGSRAAYFSAAVMFKLDKMGILKKVDLISSVSGGSITAAYYCISSDPSDASAVSGRLWEKESVKKLLRRNLIARWIGNWFWPHNFFKYWFTSYDRTDIMAQTLADNFFDRKYSGRDLKFSECNKTRPKLVINATLATTYYNGEPFTFTNEDFMELIDSNIDEHLVSRAVMASAAFPGAFQYNVLRNFYPRKDPDKLCELNDNESSKGEQYIHLFDGGIHDNLGVSSLLRVIYGSYNFKMCEFRNASSIPKLCTRIYNDGLRFKLYSPHCSIEWLNELLSRPDYYCDALKIINANPDIKSTIEIIKQDTLGYFDIEKYCGRMQEERNNPQSYGSLDYRMITDFQKLKIQKCQYLAGT